jgi:hypothetical protein
MNIRTAIIAGAAGFMLTAGAGTDAFAQRVYTKSSPRGYGNSGYGYSNGYTGVRQAQRVVAQAYRDILGREVDQNGMREYTDAMVNRGWSEADVRRALLNSPEHAQMNGYSRYNRSSRRYYRYR